MDILKQDLIFAFRSLVRNPLFTVAAVLTLGLGIGATTTIFSLVNGVVLKPLPYEEPHRLIRVFKERLSDSEQDFYMSRPDLVDMAELPAYEALSGYAPRSEVVTGLGSPALVSTGIVSSGLLEVFGVSPFMGRDLELHESEPGRPNVMVVGFDFWENQLGRDAQAIGRTIELGGETFEIVGVAPQGFDFPDGAQLWRPFVRHLDRCGRGCHSEFVLARLAPGATVEQARTQTEALGDRLRGEYPESNGNKGFGVLTLQERVVGDIRADLWILLAAVGMVLLVACANVANLLLARAQGRGTEVGIRAAMGAGRFRLITQILTESMVLAILGGAVGMGLAFGGVALLKAYSPGNIPRIDEVGIDFTVLIFTLAVSLGTALLFGLSPALSLSGSSPARVLRRSGRGGRGSGPSKGTRNVLLAGEMALSVVLLVGAGLLLMTLGRIHDIHPGFRTENVIQFGLALPSAQYREQGEVTRFFQGVEEEIRSLPGVTSVGSAYQIPWSGMGSNGRVLIEGVSDQPGFTEILAHPRPVTTGYLRTLGIPVLQGRELEPGDDENAPPVALVNEAFAREYFPGEDPLGKEFRVTVSFGFQSPTWTIVGVVPDMRSASLTGEPFPEIFVPLPQMATRSMVVVVRSEPGIESPLPAIRSIVQELDPALPLRSVRTLESALAAEMAPARFYLSLLLAFAGLAVMLAMVGLYGVVSYLVSLQRQEVGVRMALGADSGRVMKMYLRTTALPILSGLLLGVGFSLVGGRMLAGLLYEVDPRDPLVYSVVLLALLLVSTLATLIPARTASRVHPVEAMGGD